VGGSSSDEGHLNSKYSIKSEHIPNSEEGGNSEDDEDRDNIYDDIDDDGVNSNNNNSSTDSRGRHINDDEHGRQELVGDDSLEKCDERRTSIGGQRRSSSDPVNLSLVKAQHEEQVSEEEDEANIDVETIGNAPTKVRK
jgi:hypothetical protein